MLMWIHNKFLTLLLTPDPFLTPVTNMLEMLEIIINMVSNVRAG